MNSICFVINAECHYEPCSFTIIQTHIHFYRRPGGKKQTLKKKVFFFVDKIITIAPLTHHQLCMNETVQCIWPCFHHLPVLSSPVTLLYSGIDMVHYSGVCTYTVRACMCMRMYCICVFGGFASVPALGAPCWWRPVGPTSAHCWWETCRKRNSLQPTSLIFHPLAPRHLLLLFFLSHLFF